MIHLNNAVVEVREVYFPDDLKDMSMVYKPCVASKLFIHDLFPKVDAGIVLDTDIVILDDVKKLWDIFLKFDTQQLASLAPVESHYSNVDNFPYYGPPGISTLKYDLSSAIFFLKELVLTRELFYSILQE